MDPTPEPLRFTYKEDGLLLRVRPFLREVQVSLSPVDNTGFIALPGTANGLLRTPGGGFQQSAKMVWMVRDAKLQMDYHSDASTGPELAPKTIGFRARCSRAGKRASCSRINRDSAPGGGRCRSASTPLTSYCQAIHQRSRGHGIGWAHAGSQWKKP